MKLPNVVLETKDNITCVKEIIHEPKPCEDCGETVVNRRVTSRRNCSYNTIPHFKSECMACRKFRNPVTGKYEMSRTEIDNYYRITNQRKKK